MATYYHRKKVKSIAIKRKTHTSSEVKKRYNDKTYTRFQMSLRKDDDAELIQFIEEQKRNGKSVTDVVRMLYNNSK